MPISSLLAGILPALRQEDQNQFAPYDPNEELYNSYAEGQRGAGAPPPARPAPPVRPVGVRPQQPPLPSVPAGQDTGGYIKNNPVPLGGPGQAKAPALPVQSEEQIALRKQQLQQALGGSQQPTAAMPPTPGAHSGWSFPAQMAGSQSADDVYRYQHEIVHRPERHKGFMNRLRHALQGAGMGAALGGAQGGGSLGAILGGAITGGAMGGVRPETADTMYNNMVVEPGAERELEKQTVKQNIEYQKRRQELEIKKTESAIRGQDRNYDLNELQEQRAIREEQRRIQEGQTRQELTLQEIAQRKLAMEQAQKGEWNYSTDAYGRFRYNPTTNVYEELGESGGQYMTPQQLEEEYKSVAGDPRQKVQVEFAKTDANQWLDALAAQKVYSPKQVQRFKEILGAVDYAERNSDGMPIYQDTDPKTGAPRAGIGIVFGANKEVASVKELEQAQKAIEHGRDILFNQMLGDMIQRQTDYINSNWRQGVRQHDKPGSRGGGGGQGNAGTVTRPQSQLQFPTVGGVAGAVGNKPFK